MKLVAGVFLLFGLTGCSSAPSLTDEKIQEIAGGIVSTLHQSYPDNPQIVQANLDRFESLNKTRYTAATREAGEAGLHLIGDVEVKGLMIADHPEMRTCVRTFVPFNHSAIVAFWQFPKSSNYAWEFETEFSDDRWLVTNNLRGLGMGYDQTRFDYQWIPASRPKELGVQHQKRVEKYLKEHPGVQLKKVATLDQLLAAQKRQHVLQAVYRRQIKGITEEELKQLFPQLSKKDCRKIVAEVQSRYDAS